MVEGKQQALGSAVWQLRLAHQLATEAAETIQANLGLATPLALEQSALLLSLDTAWLSDGFAVNIAVHTRIATVRKQLKALQGRIEQLLRHLNEQTA